MIPDASKVAARYLAAEDSTGEAIQRIRAVLKQNLGSEARMLRVDSRKPGVVNVTWDLGGQFHHGSRDLAEAKDFKVPPNTFDLSRKAAFALFALSKLFSSRQLDVRHLRVDTRNADGREVNLALLR